MKNPRKPLVYKGFRGRSEEARTPDILTTCLLWYPKLLARFHFAQF